MRGFGSGLFAPPAVSGRMWRLVWRNYRVWRKLMMPSLAMNVAEPLIFLVGFGWGVGALVGGEVGGGNYLQFLAAGMVGYGAMYSASFESLYSAFTRMHVQRTWQGILNAPMTLDDVLLGEWLWAAAKGAMAGVAMLGVAAVMGLAPPAMLPALALVAALTALAFAGMGLAVNAVSTSYDFFSYYFSVFLMPMMMVSGAFFPVSVLPAFLQAIAGFFPLTHSVALARGLMNGEVPPDWGIHAAVLALFAVGGVYAAAVLTRRRLLQ